ncbi:MAG: ABC transporter substrate-binding protein [Saccharolobus sp.]
MSLLVIFISTCWYTYSCFGQEQKEVTLRLIAWGNPTEVKAREATLKRFEELHPNIKVKFIHVPQNYLDKLQTMLAGGDAPDIIYIGNGDYRWFVDAGQFMPLDTFIRRDKLNLSDIFPMALKIWNYKGKQYGFPADFPNQELFYNVTMFKNAGLPLLSSDWNDSNWTWKRFLEYAQKLTVKDPTGKVKQWGFRVDTSFRGWWVWVSSNGGELFSKDGKRTLIAESAAVGAFQFLQDLIYRYKVSPTVELASAMGGYDMFLGGNLGMTTYWPAIGYMRENIKSFEWDVSPHPFRIRKACAGGGSGHCISSQTKHPEEAWTLMKWLISEECVRIWTEIMGIVPPLRSVANSPVFLKPNLPPKHIMVFVEGAKYLRPDPVHPKFKEVSQLLSQELDYIWLNKAPAKDALTEIAKKVDRLLQQ